MSATSAADLEIRKLHQLIARVLDESPDGMLLDLIERFEVGAPGYHLALSFLPRAEALRADCEALRAELPTLEAMASDNGGIDG